MSEESASPADRTLRIGHFFADVGVETEALSAYGEVWRYGIGPEDNPHTHHLVEIDLRETPPVPVEGFGVGLFQPPCYEWTQRADESGENLIPRAREMAEKYCDEWIIENQPGAPLSAPEGGSLVTLHGSQFGLPVVYERQFETSYEVPEPPRNQHWRAEHRVECTRPTAYWKAVKGYTGDYPRQHLVTNALPAAYVHWLVRPLLPGYAHRKRVQTSLTEATDV